MVAIPMQRAGYVAGRGSEPLRAIVASQMLFAVEVATFAGVAPDTSNLSAIVAQLPRPLGW